MQTTVYGKILCDVNISGTPVLKDTIVEVDQATFRQLRIYSQIEKCAAPDGAEEKKKEPMLAFRVVKAPPKAK